ncbi:MAG: hypothetical protein ACD_79C00585G0007 [uncultured bacterium]|nr:MAG: hypothetical protein ACD_79C00585G0007 [uncultured bacterium]
MSRRFSREELTKKSSNVYAMVRTVAARAVEISRGSNPLLLKPKSKNPATIALEEVMAGKIKVTTLVTPDERSRMENN